MHALLTLRMMFIMPLVRVSWRVGSFMNYHHSPTQKAASEKYLKSTIFLLIFILGVPLVLDTTLTLATKRFPTNKAPFKL